MKLHQIQPPRTFTVGADGSIVISHCADIDLAPDELVTFRTKKGRQYDVGYKEWGFYATPSVNKRLVDQGFRTALVINPLGHLFVMLVESGKEALFDEYLTSEDQQVLCWLDDNEDIDRVRRAFEVKRG